MDELPPEANAASVLTCNFCHITHTIPVHILVHTSIGAMTVPQDLVAIFHASFHPTKGNIIDWSLTTDQDIDLKNVEFSALPSGLHLVEEDVVYFSKGDHRGVCIFRRRTTTDEGHRGFRLSSIGVLLAPSLRPRPWHHVKALKELHSTIFDVVDEPTEADWRPAYEFFQARKVSPLTTNIITEPWQGWGLELDGPDADPTNPTLHLSHLLRILGPSALTLYKHVLGQRRVLIYTLPPVEAASILCQVAADMCFEQQAGRNRAIDVLGMVTLNDLERLNSHEHGWVACTTDAILLDKPSYYDLVIDLTTSTPFKASRPTLSISKPLPPSADGRGPTHKLSVVRFTWSDIKLWNELERILSKDEQYHHTHTHSHHFPHPPPASADSPSSSPWSDVWRVYEDVCIVCAGLWVGAWRGNSRASYAGDSATWGRAREEGDVDLSVEGGGGGSRSSSSNSNSNSSGASTSAGTGANAGTSLTTIRTLGAGIEGRKVNYGKGAGIEGGAGNGGSGSGHVHSHARTPSSSSLSSPRKRHARMPSYVRTKGMKVSRSPSGMTPPSPDGDGDEEQDKERNEEERREMQVRTTLALLQTFHASTRFQLQQLARLIRESPQSSAVIPLVITPRDVLSFELGPMSSIDAKYIEWLGAEYGDGREVIVKRGWRDLLGLLVGL